MEKPITVKDSDCGAVLGGLHLSWASSCMQGWRLGMEDAHITTPALLLDSDVGRLPSAAWTAGWRGLALFAVFDGHGGEQVAKFVERHFTSELCSFPVEVGKEGHSEKDIAAALISTFHRMDELLQDTAKSVPELQSLGKGRADPDNIGCTACVACVTDRHVIVANAGDSRAVLSRSGNAVPLSFDHKPNSPRERARIEAAGGMVASTGQGQYRVNNNLNLSRALGDLVYKKGAGLRPEEQIISGSPDVTMTERRPDDEFVVICCDGVWDMMDNQQVVDFVQQRLPGLTDPTADVRPEDMKLAMEALLDKCLSPDLSKTGGYGGDNMTAVMFRLPQILPHRAVLKRSTSGSGGTIVVDVKFPVGAMADSITRSDVILRVSQPTASIHVGVSKRVGCVTRLIALQEYLPEGAALGDLGPGAATFGEDGWLRISLPWSAGP